MRNIIFSSLLALSVTLPAPFAEAEDYGEPMIASLSVHPAAAKPGDEVELRLTLEVQGHWHVFADTPGSAGQQKLKLDTKLPEGIESAGEWKWPAYESVFEGYEVHIYNAGKHVFTRKLKVGTVTAPVTLKTNVTWQACNPEFCGPVQVDQLSTELQIGAGAAPAATSTAAAAPVKAALGADMPAKGAPVAGTPLDMKFKALDGREVNVASLRGKVVLIDFWATWCVPCVAELPNVKAVYEKHRKRGFEVIGVTFDSVEAREKLLEMVKKKGLAWPQRFDGKMFDKPAQQLYGLKGIPATFLIDKEGRLVETHLKGEALEPAVRKYLAL